MTAQEGDRIHVEFDAVITGKPGHGSRCTTQVASDNGEYTHFVFISPECPDTQLLMPTLYNARPGDVWKSPMGTSYYVVAHEDGLKLVSRRHGRSHSIEDYDRSAYWELLYRDEA
jgi:hypothetical protein